ncbi:unnamed protein product [Victoria cruziana]
MADSEPIHFSRAYPSAPHDVPPVLPQYFPQKTGRRLSHHCRTRAVLMCVVFAFAIIGAAVFFALYVLRPSAVTYYVENAYLTEFDFIGTGTLRYTLNLHLNITNPNTMFGVYYRKLDASAYHDEELIGWVLMPTFYLGHNKTVVVHPVFGGQSVIGIDRSRVADSMKQSSDGFYSIDVGFHAEIKLQFGAFVTDEFAQKIWCELMVPLLPSGNSDPAFSRTRCKVECLNWFVSFRSLRGLQCDCW